MDEIESTVADYVRTHHESLLSAVAAAADAASADWPPGGVPSGTAARDALRSELGARDLGSDLVSLLCGAASVVEEPLNRNPVAAPPYVVVTTHGILLRATLDTYRILVELRVFDRTRETVAPLDGIQVSVETA